MSTSERPMPDFVAALEQHLRHAAEQDAAALAALFPLPAVPTPTDDPAATNDATAEPGPDAPASLGRGRGRGRGAVATPPRRRRPVRLPRLRLPVAAGSLTVVAVVLALALVLSGGGPTTPGALGEPLVLRTPLVTLPKGARPGSMALSTLGPESARITKGHAFSVQNGTAYLYRNARGVCLSAPDPSSSMPAVERGVTCVAIGQFRRFGILGAFEGDGEVDIVAAIPDGARAPTVSVRGGARRVLKPSDVGVVTYQATDPVVITLYGPGDLTQESRFLQPPTTPVSSDPGAPIAPGSQPVPGPKDIPGPTDGPGSGDR